MRPGWLAANRTATGPASTCPKSTARSEWTASSTTSASSAHCSQLGRVSPDGASDAPVPSRSNMITRARVASCRMNCACVGQYQFVSMPNPMDPTQRRSTAPSPKT